MKIPAMRALGIILIVIGIVMIAFNSFHFQTEKKVVDLGPIQVDKKENHTIAWPAYGGGLAIAAGIIVLATSRKKI